MATSLSELRKSRSSMLDKIVKNLDSGGARKEKDDRFWSLTRDKAGNGSAVIRILPPMGEDELPWVKNFTYAFKSETTGRWYIQESPTTIGLPDPVAELNSAAYASKDEAQIEEAKKRRRQSKYIANILVIKDPANPDNEGKVFLWKFGKKILDMIMAKAKPEFADETPLEVWDIDEGANLKLRIKNVAGYPNYDSSEWAATTPLAKSDDAMEEILDRTHRLSEFIKPERFKSYDDLKKELDRALNSTGGPAKTAADKIAKELSDDAPFDLDAEVKKAAPPARKVEPKATVVDDEDDSLDDFKKLLEDL
jgi:hypothetical protein